MRKNIIFFTENQYLKFYLPLAKKLYKKSFNPILILADDNEEWKSKWPYQCIPAHNLVQNLLKEKTKKNSTEKTFDEYVFFERKFLENNSLFEKSYPYTVQNIKTIDDAYKLAEIWNGITKTAIEKYRPAGIFIWNGRYLPHKAIAKTCEELNFPFYTNEIGWIPGTIFLDKGNLSSTVESLDKKFPKGKRVNLFLCNSSVLLEKC